MILDEEFLGSTLNASLWTGSFSNYTSGHENEAQSYVPRNAQVSVGHLVIESDHEKFLNKTTPPLGLIPRESSRCCLDASASKLSSRGSSQDSGQPTG